jgi:aromatic-L-amino-acid/L-tryptophan decarboxylase
MSGSAKVHPKFESGNSSWFSAPRVSGFSISGECFFQINPYVRLPCTMKKNISGITGETMALQDASADTLDPQNWEDFRRQGHRMLDDMLDYLEHIRERPVWQPIPQEIRASFHEPLPHDPSDLAKVHDTFMRNILPYAVGNAHPGFMGWVHGAGTPVGMLAEMLAAGLNANLGGRDQIPLEVERQVLGWGRELVGFPAGASGLFVTGSSMANLIALLVARTAALGSGARQQGMAGSGKDLVAYASAGAHGCIAQAMEISGLGSAALRIIPVDAQFRMEIAALEHTIAADRSAGYTPFCITGTAGTVDAGAIDDLAALASVAQREKIWFHIDGALGALGMLSPDVAPLLAGIERADSVAFDFHKWGQVPYDAGFILVRDGELHRSTFASPSAYLRREERGMAAGSPWPCDFGPDLSRGFRALKTWFTLKTYGSAKLGEMISTTCALARYLKQRIEETTELELLAPVSLNIVCFRYRCADADRVNADIVVALQESGVAAPSATTINGRFAIRAAIVNHRTGMGDMDALIGSTLAFGAAITGKR